MTDADTKNSAQKNPGEELRTSRERLGLSIQDVAVATKINAKVLKALEEGDRDMLPAKSFARGFIRSYAAYLKIDAEPILTAYNDLRADSGRERHDSGDGTSGESKPAPPSPSKSSYGEPSIASRVAIFAVIFILVGLIIFVKKLKDKYEREKITPPTTAVTPPPVNPSQNGTTSLVQTTLEHAPVAEHVTPPSTATPTKMNGAAAEKPAVVVKTTVNKTKPLPKPTSTPANMKTAAVAKAPTGTALPAKSLVKKPHPQQEIIIEALDNVDVTVRVGHEPPQKIHLMPQAVHTIKADDSIEVDVSDGGMINIVRNGRDRGVPGQLGKPIKLKYP